MDPPAPTNLGEYNFMKESVLEGPGATSKAITAAALIMCASVQLARCGGVSAQRQITSISAELR